MLTKGSLRDEWGIILQICRKVTTSLLEAGLDKNYAPVSVHWDSQALHRPYVRNQLSPLTQIRSCEITICVNNFCEEEVFSCVADHIDVSLSVQPVIFVTCLSDNK